MRLRSSLSYSLYFVTAVALTGCQLLAPYKGPVTPTPAHWKGSSDISNDEQTNIPSNWKKTLSNQACSSQLESQDKQVENQDKQEENESLTQVKEPKVEDIQGDLCNWWEVFQDPLLNQLEEQALNSSNTLWAALERVIEARSQARINFAPLLPHLNFAPLFSRSGSLAQNPLGATLGCGANNMGMTNLSSLKSLSTLPNTCNAGTTTQSPLSNLPKDFRFVQTQYLVPLNLTYEVDLWNQVHNNYYASVIRAQAASQAYLGILLSLTADVAIAYFQIRGLDAQQEVIQHNIRLRQEALDLTQARYNAGLIVYLDVSRAQVELARAKADSDDVKRLRGLQENQLATLVGTPASIFSIKDNPVSLPPPVIPDGLPSELLCRRPDIAEAERNLAANYRDIGVAYANFFPSLNLNAALGFESPFAHQLFSWHSRFWEVGWQIMQTVFDAGRNQANLAYYQARFRETMANYQQVVLQAFRDVEDALVNLEGYANQAKDLAVAVHSARITLNLAQMRYTRGLTNYLDVVDAERQLLETEQNSVIVLSNRYVSTVMLIRALGGGWGPCDCDLP